MKRLLIVAFCIFLSYPPRLSYVSNSVANADDILTFDQIFERETYELDEISRYVKKKGKIKCPKLKFVRYKGDYIRYHKPVTVHPAFKKKLIEFEKLVKEISIEIYGRAPLKIVHYGTYNCRRIGSNRNLLSEHSFGNGIDIAGFIFGKDKSKKKNNIPKRLRRPFKVDMLKHWNSSKTYNGLHQKFLRKIGKEMIERKMFRVILGPAYPGHRNHFHIDMAPYEVIAVF